MSGDAPGWRLDELGSAGRENLDPAHVSRYDAKEDAGAAAEVTLPDFWKAVALARLRAVLRPGGVLRLWDVVFDFEPAGRSEDGIFARAA